MYQAAPNYLHNNNKVSQILRYLNLVTRAMNRQDNSSYKTEWSRFAGKYDFFFKKKSSTKEASVAFTHGFPQWPLLGATIFHINHSIDLYEKGRKSGQGPFQGCSDL